MSDNALEVQVGGDHYKNYNIQPIEYITKAGLSYLQGTIFRYAIRHRNKNGAEDIEKAKHYAQIAKQMYHNHTFRGRMKTVYGYTVQFIEKNEIPEKEAEIILMLIQCNWEKIEILCEEILQEYAGLSKKGSSCVTPYHTEDK